ncbi:MAG: hypothetical protein LBM59_03305 [Ruminococcus sp.]|jgi:hypothetical protein|nr:hypothetical protein [Ruminococcus sp.]
MNFKKLIAAVAAGAMALSLMAFPASAADALTFNMSAKDSTTWADTSVAVTIEGNGDYSATLDVSATGAAGWGYLYFLGTGAAPAGYEEAQIQFTKVIIGETEFPVTGGPNGLLNNGKVDTNVFNVWYTAGNIIDMTNSQAEGQVYAFLDADGNKITPASFTVEFTISGVAEAAAETEAAETEAVAAETEAAPAETEAEPVEEAAPEVEEVAPETEAAAETEAAPAVTEAPVAEVAVTDAPATGNAPVIVVGSVMALALAGALISRKRK